MKLCKASALGTALGDDGCGFSCILPIVKRFWSRTRNSEEKQYFGPTLFKITIESYGSILSKKYPNTFYSFIIIFYVTLNSIRIITVPMEFNVFGPTTQLYLYILKIPIIVQANTAPIRRNIR